MRPDGPFPPIVHDQRSAPAAVLHADAVSLTELAHTESYPQPALTRTTAAIERGDTGAAFLTVYRSLLDDIEQWCTPPGGPLLHVIRWHALRDYVEVYSHTYPREPAYPFPPRFGPYLAYLDGFDVIVAAIDTWCEWLSRCFLPGVVPIHLLRSALDDWDESRRGTKTSYLSTLPYLPPKGVPMQEVL
jgi:hypothetical protein